MLIMQTYPARPCPKPFRSVGFTVQQPWYVRRMATWVEHTDLSPSGPLTPTPDSSLAHRSLGLSLPARTEVLRGVRAIVRAWLDSVGEPPEHWDVVVTELVTNAIQASTVAAPIRLSMHLASGDDAPGSDPRVLCSVANPGIWDWGGMEPPMPLDLLIARSSQFDASTPSGRGLRIVSALTSGAEVRVVDGHTVATVWLDRPADVWFAFRS